MRECFECKATEDLQNHHVVPRSAGGTAVVVLCYKCHRLAHGLSSNGINHSEIIKMALKEKAKTHILGHAPYGMSINEDRTEYIQIEEEQEVIRIVEDFISKQDKKWGLFTRLSRHLNNNRIQRRNGSPWTPQSANATFKRYAA